LNAFPSSNERKLQEQVGKAFIGGERERDVIENKIPPMKQAHVSFHCSTFKYIISCFFLFISLMKHQKDLHTIHVRVVNVSRSSIKKRRTLSVTVPRRLKTTITYSTDSTEGKDQYETTQDHHKPKKKTKKFVKRFLIKSLNIYLI